MQKNPVYRKIEKDYEDNVIMPELEMRKQQLAKIRSFYQPIRVDQIQKHAAEKEKLFHESLAKRH